MALGELLRKRQLDGWLGGLLLLAFLLAGDVLAVKVLHSGFVFATVHFVLTPLFAVVLAVSIVVRVVREHCWTTRVQVGVSLVLPVFVFLYTMSGVQWLIKTLGLTFNQ